jgi:hypothetical protein
MAIATVHTGTCPTCGHATLPPEPPIDSVVLDKDGDAWQLKVNSDNPGDGWACVIHGSDLRGLDWKHVIEEYGPITVVHTP